MALALLTAAAGCDLEPEAPLPAAPDDDSQVADGTTGWALVRTPTGVERLPYVARGGMAMYEGDMQLGPVARVDERRRGGAVSATAERWPEGVVQYGFHPAFSTAARATVLAAVAEMEQRLPIDFVEVPYSSHSGPWIEIKHAPPDVWYSGMSTSVGMMGCGEIHCSPHDGCRSDCGQWLYFVDDPAKSTVKHEFLHALGQFHEQSRNDRDGFVKVTPSCIDGQGSQFAKHSESLDLGPYDFSSIMHYRSTAFCVTDPANDDDPYLNGCQCLPMTHWVDGNADGKLDKVAPSSDLTREDVNSMWRTYARTIGSSSNGDGLGASVAVGDFDGDGYDDVAMGAPNNGSSDAGAVFLFRGTSQRLMPWKALTQAHVPGQDEAANDHFGAALAAGDYDHDGYDDLLIGTPDEDWGSTVDVGAAYLFRGSVGGLTFDSTFTQADGGGTNDAGDRFGASVAIGKLTNTSVSELVIGAPGDKNAGLFGGTVASGAVYVLHVDPSNLLLTNPTRLAVLTSSQAQFGARVAVGKLDGDAYEDLAIAAPAGGTGIGQVYVYAGRKPPESQPNLWTAMATYRQTLPRSLSANGDRFGEALLIGDLAGSGNGEVAVGAPGVASAAGHVFLYQLTAASLADPSPMSLLQSVAPNGAQEPGDEFGAALVALQRDPSTTPLDLVVGSPGENGAGIITTYRGEATGVSAVANLFQTVIPTGMSEQQDRFGQVLATGSLNGTGNLGSSADWPIASKHLPDLVVGAPGEKLGVFPDSGVAGGEVDVLHGLAGGALAGAGAYVQETLILH